MLEKPLTLEERRRYGIDKLIVEKLRSSGSVLCKWKDGAYQDWKWVECISLDDARKFATRMGLDGVLL